MLWLYVLYIAYCFKLPTNIRHKESSSLNTPQHKYKQYVCYFGIQGCPHFPSWPTGFCVSLNLFVHHIQLWSLSWHCSQAHNTASMTLITTTANASVCLCSLYGSSLYLYYSVQGTTDPTSKCITNQQYPHLRGQYSTIETQAAQNLLLENCTLLLHQLYLDR